jgi:hypothetical protein
LITGLLTLPLAPVRGTVWLAEVIQAEVEKELNDESTIVAQLAELDDRREAGELSAEEIEEAENELLERLMRLRGISDQDGYGGV